MVARASPAPSGSIPQEPDVPDVHTLSRSGHLVDTTGSMWRIAPEHRLNWDSFVDLDGLILRALQQFFRHLLRNSAPAYLVNQMTYLGHLTSSTTVEALRADLDAEGAVSTRTFGAFRRSVGTTVTGVQTDHYLGAFIRWYLWCVDVGLPGFDADFAAEIDAIKLRAGPKGVAVMRQDPRSGPLREAEYQALQRGLRSPAARDLPLPHRVATWLFLCFGTNPKNVRLLAEEDLIRTDLADGSVVYELRIPRIKKRTAGERDQFRTRRLIPEVGALVEELIGENHTRYADEYEQVGGFRPLIMAGRGNASLDGTPFETDRYRISASSLSAMLRNVAEHLDLQDADGQRLNLTPRRLRYTFATKLVQDGASPEEVADALDHSDTAHVMVYFNTRSDIVKRLDKAVGLALAPIAQAFMGKIVRSEDEAVRGGDEVSRIRHYSPTLKSLETVGTCGSFGFCGLYAPIACYTCNEFQAWVDGPHELVFEALEARRDERLSRGADVKMTQLHDRTMLAVAEVMLRCAKMRPEAGA